MQRLDIEAWRLEGLYRYVQKGIHPGGFLTACLENDLVEAVARADEYNRAHLVDWVSILYNDIPAGCWGSKEKVHSWFASFEPKGRDPNDEYDEARYDRMHEAEARQLSDGE